ncbi:MAG: flavodoxin domain-containing protein [Arsenophonus sp.]|nr:MAG: flavodoxin domain-containing protein [Arsenophonus sp.]
MLINIKTVEYNSNCILWNKFNSKKKRKDKTETNIYMVQFLSKISWKPKINSVFAGDLCYSNYKWFDRIMIQFIMRISKRKVDLKKNLNIEIGRK